MYLVNTTYTSVARTVRYLADRHPHLRTSEITLQFPTSHAALVARLRAHLRALPRRSPTQKVVVIVDSIVCNPGVVLPWAAMVCVCRAEGVLSVVDAAHALGQVRVDLRAVRPDFWVSVRALCVVGCVC